MRQNSVPDESDIAFRAFLAGVIAGIFSSIYLVTMTLLNKEAYIREITKLLQDLPIDQELPFTPTNLYHLTLVTTPISISLILSVIGILIALAFNKFKISSPVIQCLICIAAGAVFGGVSFNLAVDNLSAGTLKGLNILVGAGSGFIFYLGLIFKLSVKRSVNPASTLKHQTTILYILINMVLIGTMVIITWVIDIKVTYLATIYMFFPFVATILLMKIRGIRFSQLGVTPKLSVYFLIAWFLPLILLYVCVAINLLFPGVEYSPIFAGLEKYGVSAEFLKKKYGSYPFSPLVLEAGKGLLAGITINMIFAFGEEIGWRGLLYHELRRYGFWTSSCITGILWGLWHAPLILAGHNYPQYPVVGIVLWIIVCISMSPILTFLRDRSGSVISAAIFHGTVNAVAGISIGAVYGGNNLIDGFPGASGIITLILLNITLYLYLKSKGPLQRQPPEIEKNVHESIPRSS